MSARGWTKNTGRSRVSVQPVNCTDLKDAFLFISEKGGKAFRKQLLAHLLRTGRKIERSNNIISSLNNFNFVAKSDKHGQLLTLKPWVPVVGRDLKTKEEIMLTLSAGVLSGGQGDPQGAKAKENEAEQLTGTRLILGGLRSIADSGRGPPSINDLAYHIQESQALATQLICTLLDIPGERDRYSIGIIELQGKRDRKETLAVKYKPQALRAVQVSIISRYLCAILPKVVSETFRMDFETALAKGLAIISADSIRQALASYPNVWIGFGELDGLIEEVTKDWKYTWWPEDAHGGGRGLNRDQTKVYLRLDSMPRPVSLRYLN